MTSCTLTSEESLTFAVDLDLTRVKKRLAGVGLAEYRHAGITGRSAWLKKAV